jgi:hypothetical protein
MIDYNHSLMCSYRNNYPYSEEELKGLESENASLQHIYFPIRVFNLLRGNDVYTIKDLMSKSESDLLKIDGIGRKAVNSIKEEFNKINKAIKTDYYIGKRKEKNRNVKEVPDYKFNEDKFLKDIKAYIDETYTSHYAKSNKQATENIVDQGHGTGFCMGNILKYAQRYGKKDGYNKKDLLKIVHYAIIQMSIHHV